jgi:aldose 1-epimerase
MYTINKSSFGPLMEVKICNTETKEWFSFIPGFSASINGLVLKKGGKMHQLIHLCDSYEMLMDIGKRKFMGSKLFPFPNRIKDGSYSFEGMNYNLPINYPQEGHAIHGLVLEKSFNIVKEEGQEQRGVVSIEYNGDGTDSGYPFKYCLAIDFCLDENGFSCKTKVTNTDNKNLPLGDGWHPYFTLGGQLDAFYMQLPTTHIVEVDNRMIPTGAIQEISKYTIPEKIEADTFDTCFKLTEHNGIAEICLTNKEKDLSLVMWQETGKNKYNYMQIYTPPSRDFIAIEPMTCEPDVFNTKNGLIVLQPNESVDFTFGVKLK